MTDASQPQSQGQPSLEGRLMAQRKLLARIVAHLGDEAIDAFLAERGHVNLEDEDPGATPDPAFAIEGAMADEMRQIADLAARFRKD
ncbi:hypothetical protein [Wenxinia saemankumensis]|uniref:Uncharacterized protein n=1 Tax=Wenxinia saemankumensis TaxID=1447782 RepID=A0A1M6C2Q5_9RHOB|nr:hypothetical protein [Wenxinia saemankumensis]SHI55325.1 hypothetical protein SAMN05444417_0976 [Wenxinia saemankumensis]